MALPFIDSRAFPVVHVIFGRELSIEECRQHIANLEALLAERGSFLTISEIDQMTLAGHKADVRMAFTKEIDRLTARYGFHAEFIVVSSRGARGLLTAYTWIRRVNRHPVFVFATLNEARDAAARFMRERRIAKSA